MGVGEGGGGLPAQLSCLSGFRRTVVPIAPPVGFVRNTIVCLSSNIYYSIIKDIARKFYSSRSFIIPMDHAVPMPYNGLYYPSHVYPFTYASASVYFVFALRAGAGRGQDVIANVPPHWNRDILEDHGSRWCGQVKLL